MSAELMKKVDDLTTTVATLAKTVETLSKVAPPDISKLETTLGDLQKRADETAAKLVEQERNSIISKMANDGRVAMKEDGVAFKADELQKMDLAMLKFASRNSMVLPTIAKTIYTGTGNGPEEKKFTKVDKTGKEVPLTGSELIQKSWEHLELNKMIKAGTTAGL